MNRTKTTVMAGGAILLAVVVKLHYFPVVREAYFKPDFDSLRRVPARIAAVQPTHARHSTGDPIRNLIEHDTLLRAVGQDVTLRNLMAEAYDCSPGWWCCRRMRRRAISISGHHAGGAARTSADGHPEEPGLCGRHETRDTDVLRLKVETHRCPA